MGAGAGRVCVLLTPPLPYSEAAARCREGGGGAEIWGGDGDNVTLAEVAESLGSTAGAFWILNTGTSLSPGPSLWLWAMGDISQLKTARGWKTLFFSVICFRNICVSVCQI